MKKHHIHIERPTAVLCALCLAVAVMSGSVFARDESIIDIVTPEPEATFVVVESSSAELGLESDEVVDNRSEIPCYAGDTQLYSCRLTDGIPYMNVKTFFGVIGLGNAVSSDGQHLTVSAEGLSLTCTLNEHIIVCNDRYFYAEQGVRAEDGEFCLPVELLVKCAGIGAEWDRTAWCMTLYPEDAAYLEGGASFYDETDVYWLSRLIYASVGDKTVEAQIGVGNVVMNRVNDPAFDGQDTVYDVIFAKNQFDVVINGMIYMTPDDAAIQAAKIALEGCDLVDGATAFCKDTPEAGQSVTAVLDGITFTTALEAQS